MNWKKIEKERGNPWRRIEFWCTSTCSVFPVLRDNLNLPRSSRQFSRNSSFNFKNTVVFFGRRENTVVFEIKKPIFFFYNNHMVSLKKFNNHMVLITLMLSSNLHIFLAIFVDFNWTNKDINDLTWSYVFFFLTKSPHLMYFLYISVYFFIILWI